MTDAFPTSGRLAGIDYGTVRIGVAITDGDQILASPIHNYTRQSASDDAGWFKRFVAEEKVAGFVVGLPIHNSGEESQKSFEAREFGKWLAAITSTPVCFFDERYTSVEAESLLGQAKLTKKKRKQRLDMLAAQIMLSAFLESNRQSRQSPGSLDG